MGWFSRTEDYNTKDVFYDDIRVSVSHEGEKVGEGVYCTPKIEKAEPYTGTTEINGKLYKTVLMVRVKPNKIRCHEDKQDYWVVNGTIIKLKIIFLYNS